MDWTNLLQTFGGMIAGTLATLLTLGSTKKKAQAEADSSAADADRKEWELEEDRIKSLQESQMQSQQTIATLTATIDSLAIKLKEKNENEQGIYERNRELSDRLYATQQKLNQANERIFKLTEERDTARAHDEYHRQWKCERTDCQDPRGPLPPERARIIQGLTYKDPKNDDYTKEGKQGQRSENVAAEATF